MSYLIASAIIHIRGLIKFGKRFFNYVCNKDQYTVKLVNIGHHYKNLNSAVPKGTTDEHYFQFIGDAMNIIDEFSGMKEYLIILDNATTHTHEIVDPIVIPASPVDLLRIKRNQTILIHNKS